MPWGCANWPNSKAGGWPIPKEWPTHEQIPYGFKAFAREAARKAGFPTLLWCDACMVAVRPMEPLWEKIERDGYMFMENGFSNYEWTADSAYLDLFAKDHQHPYDSHCLASDRAENKKIPHVVAGCFGLSMRHDIGRAFLAEYYRLASETKAFCGPWINEKHARALMPGVDLSQVIQNGKVSVCGDIDVKGHRHDQTAASVIAWRLGMKLSKPPEFFSYGKVGDVFDERTLLLADGSYK